MAQQPPRKGKVIRPAAKFMQTRLVPQPSLVAGASFERVDSKKICLEHAFIFASALIAALSKGRWYLLCTQNAPVTPPALVFYVTKVARLCSLEQWRRFVPKNVPPSGLWPKKAPTRNGHLVFILKDGEHVSIPQAAFASFLCSPNRRTLPTDSARWPAV